jgi:hypothetical protein
LITSGIKINHFILNASRDNIIKRLDSRKDSTEWAYNQVDRCIKAFEENRFDAEIIDTDNSSIKDVVEYIFNFIYT